MRFDKFLLEQDDERFDDRNVHVFDLDSLFMVKPEIRDIFSSTWMEGPPGYVFDPENDFVIDFSEQKALRESRDELEDEQYKRTEVAKPGVKYARLDKGSNRRFRFGPGYLTDDHILMFKNDFGQDRFIRPVPQYDAFYTGSWPIKSAAKGNKNAWHKYYKSTEVLDPNKFEMIHEWNDDLLNKARQASEDKQNALHFVSMRPEDEDVIDAVVELLSQNNVRAGFASVHLVGNDENKKQILKKLKDRHSGRFFYHS